MALDLPSSGHVRPAPAILIVDDDRRVIELLQIALEAHGYRVLAAGDGEEALDVARRERPDLVVLDVRLPKRSGFEVCNRLRNDPDDPLVPILIVSAAAEVDSRVQGLTHGADDYLVKPFSPKELVARVQRLLARTLEAREVRRTGQRAEAELRQARDDAQRSQRALRQAQSQAERVRTLAAELDACADAAAIGERLLLAVATGVEVDSAVLLAPAGGRLEVIASHGIDPARIRGLSLAADGELVRLLAALGRVACVDELERFPEMRAELPALATPGFVALVALTTDDGLEGVLLLGERADAAALDRAQIELTAALGEAAAHALAGARKLEGPLEASCALLGGLTPAAPGRDLAVEEVAAVVARIAGALSVPAGDRRRVAWALAIGPVTGAVKEQLHEAATRDPSGALARLVSLMEEAAMPPAPDTAAPVTPADLVGLGWHAIDDCAQGLPPTLAWGRALLARGAGAGELPALLRHALRESRAA
jgi:DNA-binding response OmpR family regulator